MGGWGRTADVGRQGMRQFGGKSFLSVYRLSLTGGRKMIIPSDQAKRMTKWGDSLLAESLSLLSQRRLQIGTA